MTLTERELAIINADTTRSTLHWCSWTEDCIRLLSHITAQQQRIERLEMALRDIAGRIVDSSQHWGAENDTCACVAHTARAAIEEKEPKP